MTTLQPLFPGDSEIDELFRIFRTCGTPSEDQESDTFWPGVSALENWKDVFPCWKPHNLNRITPRLCEVGTVWSSPDAVVARGLHAERRVPRSDQLRQFHSNVHVLARSPIHQITKSPTPSTTFRTVLICSRN